MYHGEEESDELASSDDEDGRESSPSMELPDFPPQRVAVPPSSPAASSTSPRPVPSADLSDDDDAADSGFFGSPALSRGRKRTAAARAQRMDLDVDVPAQQFLAPTDVHDPALSLSPASTSSDAHASTSPMAHASTSAGPSALATPVAPTPSFKTPALRRNPPIRSSAAPLQLGADVEDEADYAVSQDLAAVLFPSQALGKSRSEGERQGQLGAFNCDDAGDAWSTETETEAEIEEEEEEEDSDGEIEEGVLVAMSQAGVNASARRAIQQTVYVPPSTDRTADQAKNVWRVAMRSVFPSASRNSSLFSSSVDTG